ncbi:MAG: exosome complex RNA-binding protein Csl4 [Candidatus Hodarchaeaceae archaeon]|nr:exosome complex RNA-binding protein Csl4 [Candidatus Hodarchaeaceae archaeon]
MDEEIKTGDFVVPGDFLATAEEFMPGEGAYEEDSKIYSSRTGVVLVDARTKRISVFPRTPVPPELKRGDTVIGRVEEVRDQSANVHIGVLRGREDRQLPLPDLGVIHVSQVRGGYVKDLGREFKPGDIVRARVVNARRGQIQLSTVGDNLGVIVATCSRCRARLEKDDARLRCSNCGNVEFRKVASDYRQGVL